ncbi:MAG: creatininase family protein [candidate division NC10 bacterium]|nr:creatininase family protein [candidate division NC10 bacterium]MBI3085692.1 creatininase family protein [candidate division NC10 bacterium]
MPKDDPIHLAELTKDEFAAAMQAGRWLLLPFGAVEQHGPHLPLGTDLFYAEHLCAAVAERIHGLVAPPLPYGVCRTMRNFPGTISLAPATLGAVVREVVAEYIRHGGRKFALITGHAEPAQMEAMREAVLPLVNADAGLVVLTIGPYDFLDPIRREADLVSKDGHAGSIETSEMLVVAEQMVRMDRLPKVTRPRLSRFRVLANPETEYPAGVRGDTSKVSRELGERAIRHVVSEIATLLERIEREGTE